MARRTRRPQTLSQPPGANPPFFGGMATAPLLGQKQPYQTGGGPDPGIQYSAGAGVNPDGDLVRARRAAGIVDVMRNPSGKFPRLNPIALPSQEWVANSFDREMLLVPSQADTDLDGITYYAPDLKPPGDPTLVTGDAGFVMGAQDCLRSIGGAVCYVPSGGRWWFYNSSDQDVRYLQIACDNSMVAVQFFAKAQSQKATVTVGTAANGVTSTAAARNLDRKGIVLQNQHATAPLRYGWDTTDLSTNYMVLLATDTVFWTGDAACSQNLAVEGGGAAVSYGLTVLH
jgi:hypothetical protein